MKMHKNPAWLFFLGCITLVTVLYSGRTALTIIRYFQLTQETTPTAVQWSIKKKSSDRFYIKGDYTFTAKGSSFDGKTTFKTPVLKNHLAAKDALQQFQNKEWTVSYNPNNGSHSTIDKQLPLKEIFYTGALLTITAYFACIGFYVGGQKR